MVKANLDKKYFCCGENYLRSIPIGYCGEEMRLIDFLMICFPGYEESEVRAKFVGYTEKQIKDYLYVNGGKRLTKISKTEY